MKKQMHFHLLRQSNPFLVLVVGIIFVATHVLLRSREQDILALINVPCFYNSQCFLQYKITFHHHHHHLALSKCHRPSGCKDAPWQPVSAAGSWLNRGGEYQALRTPNKECVDQTPQRDDCFTMVIDYPCKC